ncbi:MAG: hypothetical protein KIS78_02340 [Labilithrix sp.]|nr:hypothetical protein [Labilithrix sp.]
MSARPLSPLRSAAAWAVLTTGALGGLIAACEVYADPVTAPFSPSFGGVPDGGLTTTRTPPIACSYEPRENAPCTQRNAICEYGASPDTRCNTLFVCAHDSQYGSYWTEQTPPSCTAECPSSSEIVDGAPCDLGDAGASPEAELHCTTSVATCVCTTGRDGANAHPRQWVCTVPAAGCPTSRPLLGQPCSGVRSCDYGACASKRGMRMICEDDVWQTEIAECE